MEEPIAFHSAPVNGASLPPLVFVITARNASKWIADCLWSVLRQHGDHWRAIVVDDASEDDTWNKISTITSELRNRVTAWRTDRRQWKMFNFAQAMVECRPHEVVVELDGDDRLLRDDVAIEIASLHRDFDVVWTQHIIDCSGFPDWDAWYSTALPDRWTRFEPWRPSIWTRDMFPGHLRTFKRYLFDVVRDEDMRWNGEWIRSAADVAYFTPILEAAAEPWKYHYVRPCACYRITPANDFLTDSRVSGDPAVQGQMSVATYLRTLPVVPRMEAQVVAIPIHNSVDSSVFADAAASLRRSIPSARLYFGVAHALPEPSIMPGYFRACNVVDLLRSHFPSYRYDPHCAKSREAFSCAFTLFLLRRTRCDAVLVIDDLTRADPSNTRAHRRLQRDVRTYDELETRLHRLLNGTGEVP